MMVMVGGGADKFGVIYKATLADLQNDLQKINVLIPNLYTPGLMSLTSTRK